MKIWRRGSCERTSSRRCQRVTNRVTLLALNAALRRPAPARPSPRSPRRRGGSEFAGEDRQICSGEREYKVGETITAIHAASEHAKSSLGGARAANACPRLPSSAVTRAEEIRKPERGRRGAGRGAARERAKVIRAGPFILRRRRQAGDLEPTAPQYDMDPEGGRPSRTPGPGRRNPTDAESTSDSMLEGPERGPPAEDRAREGLARDDADGSLGT
jgi:hypothetical protein